MPSKLDRAYFALQEILQNIDLADAFLSGLTLETFWRDQRTIYAVVRCLQIISEAASKRVSDEEGAASGDRVGEDCCDRKPVSSPLRGL
jgi:uncharacterized protein with HEPN domain